MRTRKFLAASLAAASLGAALAVQAQLPFPPVLLGGRTVVTDTSEAFLKPTDTLREGVAVAAAPPTVDFLYYPGQDHPGRPWSVWGDGCAAGTKYYSAIGDHHSPKGTAQVYEYDSASKQLRQLVDLRTFLEASGAVAPEVNYLPAKIHSRLDLGSDGWLYYATHRGSPRTTNDAHRYRGDWIFRTHPASGKTEIVAAQPVPKHSIPASVLDPERMRFYGGTAAGSDAPSQAVQFLAYDVRNRRVLLTADDGPKRCAIFARSTGCVYWDGKKYDPQANRITACPAAPDVRSATAETPQGVVYGTSERSADLWAFDVKSEMLTRLGPGAVAKAEYTVSMDADPTGRYLYYIPGAHGGGPLDGTPVVQYDVRARRRKVIAFLHPFYFDRYGYQLEGTFSSALDPTGEILYVTWNGQRRGTGRGWESCALTAIHIPASERP